jgi:hypothetical protein
MILFAGSGSGGGHSGSQASSDDTIFDCELVGQATGVVLGAVALPGATLVTGGPIGGVILSGLIGITFAEIVETICNK